jgi:hypothetical protein
MSAEPVSQHFRGVLCRHCGKPVRIPSIVSRKERAYLGKHDENDSQSFLDSKVFVLRCRACERESIYAINQIVDCAPAQTMAAAASHSEAAL